MNSIVQPKQLVQATYSPISAGESHYGVIDENGNLSMIGNNDEYQLGNGTTLLSKVPVPLYFPSKVVSISCGHDSTGAVTEDGKVYLWGSTGEGLGESGTKYPIKSGKTYPIKKPTLAIHLEDKFAVKIVINPTSNYGYGVIFRDGSAYVKMVVYIGNSYKEINNIINVGSGIIDISLFYRTAYFLTKEGKIYTSGHTHLPFNSKYVPFRDKNAINIGLGNLDGEPTLNPGLIPFRKIVRQMSRGRKGLMALTTEGELFTMNSYGDEGPNTVHILDTMSIGPEPEGLEGKTGLLDLSTALEKSKPQKIPIPDKIRLFSSNIYRDAVIVEDGRLYMWGVEFSSSGTVIPNLSNVKFRKERATRKMVMIENPIQVDIGGKVKYVDTGRIFAIAVAEDRVVNYWGTNDLKQPAIIKDRWYKNCANPESYVTREEWEQETDYIQIYSRNLRTGELSENPVCYERKSMIRAIETQVFADWVPMHGRTLDVIGHGGGPGKKRFYKTILLYYIDYSSYLLLKDPSIREYIRELKHQNQRIGNLNGTFGIGQNHGQSPGFDIYSLKPKTP